MDRDTLWFRRPPPRRSRVTHMNSEEKVSPTYHHRRSTGAPIRLSPWGHCAGASARSPVWSARAGFDMQRECGLWTVPGIACGIDVPLEVERLMSLALQEGETQTEE